MSSDLAKEIWNKVLEKYFSSLTDQGDIIGYNTWLAQTKGYDFTPEAFVVSVPSKFFGDFVMEHYGKILKEYLRIVIGTDIPNLKFHYEDIENPMKRIPYEPEIKNTNETNLTTNKFTSNIIIPKQEKNDDTFKSQLNPRYTFQNFVVGNGNKFAHAASYAVANNPGTTYNPLFIYGEVGVGKTHIMQAIGHYVLEKNPNAKIYYTSSEAFMNEMIYAIQQGEKAPMLFRQKYRSVDLLLIDDIQFLEGKEGTQEEFFHTFNSLYENKKQIILTSDRQPKDMKKLEDRLISRFQWGLVTDIQPPDYETRVAILKKKIDNENISSVQDDVIDFIAKNVSSNIRELEGALIKLLAEASYSGRDITIEFANEVLKKEFISSAPPITMDSIIEAVCKYYGIPTNDLFSQKRTNEISEARQICMYLIREKLNSPLQQIASKLGKKDHSTVIHAYNKISELINTNPKIKIDIENIKKNL